MRTPVAAIALIALFSATACGAEGDPPGSEPATTNEPMATTSAPEATTSAPEATTNEPTATTAPTECEEVPQRILDLISGDEIEPIRGSAYRSPDYEKVYFVAIEFAAEGIPNQVGVWATTSIDPAQPGLTLAVDGFAQEFTSLPPANETEANISPADPGVEAAKECLG